MYKKNAKRKQNLAALWRRDSCEIPQEKPQFWQLPPTTITTTTNQQSGNTDPRWRRRAYPPAWEPKLFPTITIDYCKQKQCDPKLAKQTNKNSQQIVKPSSTTWDALTQVTHRSYLSREKERKNSEMIKQFCWLMLCHRERDAGDGELFTNKHTK